jgi:hypothetical protein
VEQEDVQVEIGALVVGRMLQISASLAGIL